VPVSNFVKIYAHSGEKFTASAPENQQVSRKTSKSQKQFKEDQNEYFEAGHYLVRTSEIFPYDMETAYL